MKFTILSLTRSLGDLQDDCTIDFMLTPQIASFPDTSSTTWMLSRIAVACTHPNFVTFLCELELRLPIRTLMFAYARYSDSISSETDFPDSVT